ncbi:MAG: hypothetical protein IPI35_34850 [Deltaproteobacteria bacterium]|nr:hypothetical protein [Deltaproteobacteria bacterium]
MAGRASGLNVGGGGQRAAHTALVAAVDATSNLSPTPSRCSPIWGGPGAGDEVVLRAAAAAGALLKAKPTAPPRRDQPGDGAVRLNAVATL